MKTITPKNKQTISKHGAESTNMLPRRGPGPAAMRTKGMNQSVATGDKKSAKAY